MIKGSFRGRRERVRGEEYSYPKSRSAPSGTIGEGPVRFRADTMPSVGKFAAIGGRTGPFRGRPRRSPEHTDSRTRFLGAQPPRGQDRAPQTSHPPALLFDHAPLGHRAEIAGKPERAPGSAGRSGSSDEMDLEKRSWKRGSNVLTRTAFPVQGPVKFGFLGEIPGIADKAFGHRVGE